VRGQNLKDMSEASERIQAKLREAQPRQSARVNVFQPDGALEGVTRDSVLRLAGTLGIEAREQTLTRVDLLGADEAFLTGTGVRIVPIRSLDGARLRGAVPGPLTEKLSAAFADYARSDGVPFLVEELLAAAMGTGRLQSQATERGAPEAAYANTPMTAKWLVISARASRRRHRSPRAC